MSNHPLRDRVIECFATSWQRARPENRAIAVEFLTRVYDRFSESRLADPIFESELTYGCPKKYAQRTGELLLADYLWSAGFSLESKAVGPDFRIVKNGQAAWVELHTPEPKDIPDNYFSPAGSVEVRGFPATEINLRWTNAIAEKTRKHVGYLESGIVRGDEPYIIAVNSRLLNPFAMMGLNGISQKPIPVEILFAVGPVELEISRETGEITDQRHQHRASLTKPRTGSAVPCDTFLDESYSAISAVWGLDLLEQVACGKSHHSVMVYNPLATSRIPSHWIPADEHWGCIINEDHYLVERLMNESDA